MIIKNPDRNVRIYYPPGSKAPLNTEISISNPTRDKTWSYIDYRINNISVLTITSCRVTEHELIVGRLEKLTQLVEEQLFLDRSDTIIIFDNDTTSYTVIVDGEVEEKGRIQEYIIK